MGIKNPLPGHNQKNKVSRKALWLFMRLKIFHLLLPSLGQNGSLPDPGSQETKKGR